jgi:hypothetical protein
VSGRPLRIALFTLESLASSEAVLAFARAERARLVLVGRSDPYRPASGGALGQMRRHLARSGPAMLPYLAVNFSLPRIAAALRGGSGLVRFCQREGVPLMDVADVNGPEVAAALRDAGADLIVSFHFDQIFAAETLALAPLGGINLHPSLLPRHRGPMPAFWALAEPDRATGVSVHRLVPRIDAGAILAQQAVALPAGVSASAAARLLHLAGVAPLSAVLARIAAGTTEERAAVPLPYRPFPDRAAIRAARQAGLRLVAAGDLRAAWAAGSRGGAPAA